MRTVTRVSTLKFKNIDKAQAKDLGQEGLELKLPAREHGRELRLEKEETAAIIDHLVGLIRLNAG